MQAGGIQPLRREIKTKCSIGDSYGCNQPTQVAKLSIIGAQAIQTVKARPRGFLLVFVFIFISWLLGLSLLYS